VAARHAELDAQVIRKVRTCEDRGTHRAESLSGGSASDAWSLDYTPGNATPK
jgi:hypothetical protein